MARPLPRRHGRRQSRRGPGRRTEITGIALTVRGTVDGLDEAGFLEAAENAKSTCPISKALAAVDITLDAALAG